MTEPSADLSLEADELNAKSGELWAEGHRLETFSAELDELDQKWSDAVELAKRYRHHGGDGRRWMPWSAYGAPLELQAKRRQAILCHCAGDDATPDADLEKPIGAHDREDVMPHAELRQYFRQAHALKGPAREALKAAHQRHARAHADHQGALAAHRERWAQFREG